jgi:hypothetical protein
MLTKKDLQQIARLFDGQFERIDSRFVHIEKTLDRHSKELRTLRQDQKIMLNLLDREQMFQRRRLDRVETHLQLPSLTQD